MDFFEATSAIKKNKKVKRADWKNDEFIWLTDKYLVHSKPYFNDEKDTYEKIGIMGHFIYVAEIGDIEAKDWQVINE